MAAWDATARLAEKSIADLLGGSNRSMPATAIVGYPPALMGPRQAFDQVRRLYGDGWRRFKAPVAADRATTVGRLRAILRAAPDGWVGCDGAWVYEDVEWALALLSDITDVGRLLRGRLPTGQRGAAAPAARGGRRSDRDGRRAGRTYYPEALVAGDAVDVVRIEVGCMGGVPRLRGLIETCERAGRSFAPHMFAYVHSQLFSARARRTDRAGFRGDGGTRTPTACDVHRFWTVAWNPSGGFRLRGPGEPGLDGDASSTRPGRHYSVVLATPFGVPPDAKQVAYSRPHRMRGR